MAACYEILNFLIKFFSAVLIVFSFLNAAAGAVLLGLGIFVFVDLAPEEGGNLIMSFAHIHGAVSQPGLHKAALFMMISGLVVLLYGVTSLLAVCRKSYRFMGLYITLLVLSIIFEATAGFYVVRFQQEVDDVLKTFLKWTIKEKYVGLETESQDFFSIGWDFIQKEFSCCGAINGTDWSEATNWDNNVTVLQSNGSLVYTNLTVPLSCCKLMMKSQLYTRWFGQLLTRQAENIRAEAHLVLEQPCLYEPTQYNSYIDRGCLSSLASHLLQYNATILGGMVTVIFVQIAGIVLTIILYKLAKELKHDDQKAADKKKRNCRESLKMKRKSRPKHSRETRKKYAYFDDDFDDKWDGPL